MMRLMAVLPAMKLSDICAYGYDEECDLTSKANQKIGGSKPNDINTNWWNSEWKKTWQ